MQAGPGFAAVAAGDGGYIFVLHVDAQLVKEALVGESPGLGVALLVDLVDATQDRQRYPEGALDVGVDGAARGKHSGGLVEVAGDAVVFACGEVTGDGAVDHAPCQSPPLGVKLGDAGGGPGEFRCGLAVLLVEFSFEAEAGPLGVGFGEPLGAVVAQDGVFHGFDAQVGQLAVGAAPVAAEAVEVAVGAFGQRVAQAAAAAGAPDAALEVVVVEALLLPGPVAGVQQLPHPVK